MNSAELTKCGPKSSALEQGCARSTDTTEPIRPEATASLASAKGLPYLRWKFTKSRAPTRSAAALMRSAADMSSDSGFSMRMFLTPASIAAVTCASRSGAHVEMVHPSSISAANISRMSV